jgi:virulence-associated protein VagC
MGEIGINQKGDAMTEHNSEWDAFFDTLSVFGEDFLADRDDSLPQEREWFS